MTADEQFSTGQLEQTIEAPQPIEGSDTASISSTFAKLFSRYAKKELVDAGREAFIKTEAKKVAPKVEKEVAEISEKKLTDFDPEMGHQINFDAINTPEDVKVVIGHMNEVNKEAIQTQRREVVPDVELKALADDMTTDPATIKKVLGLKPGEILPPEYILSMKQTLQQSGTRLRELANKVASPEGDNTQAIIDFHKQREFHSQFTKQFMGVRAEYGRGLRALGVDVDQSAVPMADLLDRLASGNLDTKVMAQQIAMATDDKSLNQVLKAQRSPLQKFADMFHEIFMGSILSGVQTHVVNTTGNALKVMSMPLDTAVASIFKADGTDVIGKGEALAQVRGMMESSVEALVMAGKVLKTGEAYGGVSKIDIDYNRAISSNTLGIKEGTTLAWTVDTVGKTVRLAVDNLMGAEDAFFKIIAERGKLRQLAHREAVERGLKGSDYDKHIAFRMAEPTPQMREQATMSGLEATFQQPLGKFGRSVQGVRANTPGGRYIMPFVKTPINLLYEGFVERTPIAIKADKFKEALRKGGAEAQTAKAKLAIGTAVNSAMIGFALSGQITGSYPKDRKMRQVMQDAGVKENSFVFENEDGTKTYHSFDRLEPFNSVLKLYANIAQTAKMASLDEENPDYTKQFNKVAAGTLVAITEATINQTFMKGISDAINMLTDPARHFVPYYENLTKAHIPLGGALKSLAKELDPVVKDAQGLLDKINRDLPGMGDDVPPRLDNFGKKVKYDHNLAPLFWQGGIKGKKDKVYLEVERLAETTKRVPVYKPSKYVGGYKLNSDEYFYYTYKATNDVVSGKTMYQKVKQVMNTTSYKAADDYDKVIAIQQVRDTYYEYGKAQLLQQYPHIQKYSMDKKQYELKLRGLR